MQLHGCEILEELNTEVTLDDEIVNAYGLGGGRCSFLRKRIDRISLAKGF